MMWLSGYQRDIIVCSSAKARDEIGAPERAGVQMDITNMGLLHVVSRFHHDMEKQKEQVDDEDERERESYAQLAGDLVRVIDGVSGVIDGEIGDVEIDGYSNLMEEDEEGHVQVLPLLVQSSQPLEYRFSIAI